MSQALTDQTLSAANDAITATLGSANQPVGSVLFSIASGTYGTAVIKFQAQQKSGGSWVNIAAALVETPQTLVSGNISPTDNTAYTYRVSGVEGLYAVRMLLVSISSGSISASGSYVNVSEMATTIMPLPLSTASTPQTITSTSATALAVGANGTTNPVFQVDANTASVATGLKVTGAAAAARVALAVISSGTNEGLDVNAKGSGTIRIGNSSTGAVLIGSGTNGPHVLSGTLTGGGLLTCALQIATSGPLVYSGSGAPTISAAVQGSIYLRTDGSSTSTRLYVATNTSGTWTPVTTAA